MLKHIVYPKIQVDSIESSKIIPSVGTILNGTTGVLASIDYSTFFAVRYFVAIKDSTGNVAAFDYIIANDGSGGVRQSKFGSINSGMNILTDTIVQSGFVKFEITNNTGSDITWKLQTLSF